MSELGRKHECRDLFTQCGQPIHLRHGVEQNVTHVWHFRDTDALHFFLKYQGWTLALINELETNRRIDSGDEWVTLESTVNV